MRKECNKMNEANFLFSVFTAINYFTTHETQEETRRIKRHAIYDITRYIKRKKLQKSRRLGRKMNKTINSCTNKKKRRITSTVWKSYLICCNYCFLGLVICLQMNTFVRKPIPLIQVLPLAIAFRAFVVFINLSLEYNIIGAYLLSKVLTTPVVAVISW